MGDMYTFDSLHKLCGLEGYEMATERLDDGQLRCVIVEFGSLVHVVDVRGTVEGVVVAACIGAIVNHKFIKESNRNVRTSNSG